MGRGIQRDEEDQALYGNREDKTALRNLTLFGTIILHLMLKGVV
jgi:hypothetical protein